MMNLIVEGIEITQIMLETYNKELAGVSDRNRKWTDCPYIPAGLGMQMD